MQSRDFAFWLQGFFELTDSDHLTPEQVAQIKTHLALVFRHDDAMEHSPAPIRKLELRKPEVPRIRQSFPRC